MLFGDPRERGSHRLRTAALEGGLLPEAYKKPTDNLLSSEKSIYSDFQKQDINVGDDCKQTCLVSIHNITLHNKEKHHLTFPFLSRANSLFFKEIQGFCFYKIDLS